MATWPLRVKTGVSVTGGTSPVLDIGAYANAAGTNPTVLKLAVHLDYVNGTFSSVVVQDSADNSSFATLWDTSALTGDQEVYVYTWDQYIRVLYTYTQGSSTSDPGARVTFNVTPYGMPGWDEVVACRWEHCRAVMPGLFDTSVNFQGVYDEQRAAAKRELELRLRARGVDPNLLFTDAHQDEPCAVGLEMPGAFLTLRYIMANSNVVRSESWQNEMDFLQKQFDAAFEMALSGSLQQDKGQDSAPGPEDGQPVALKLSR